MAPPKPVEEAQMLHIQDTTTIIDLPFRAHATHRYTPLSMRLWCHTRIGSGCWEWQGIKTCGYGRISWRGKLWRVHRLVYVLAYGPIAHGLFVCHRCDNPSCVRPGHLFLGTPAQNSADMRAKGRSSALWGDRRPNAKISNQQVREIRELLNRGVKNRDVAEMYHVSRTLISEIKNGHARHHG